MNKPLKCELSMFERFKKLIFVIILIVILLSYIIIVDITNKKEIKKMYQDSLENPLIISDDLYNEIYNLMIEQSPKEYNLAVYGHFINNSLIIDNWDKTNIIKSSIFKVYYTYIYNKDTNYLGMIHSHTLSNGGYTNCKLSNTDLKEINRNNYSYAGLMCDNFKYIIIYDVKNNYKRYIYIKEVKGGGENAKK